MENQTIEKKMMSIVSEDGTVEEVEVILAFEFKDTKKEYSNIHRPGFFFLRKLLQWIIDIIKEVIKDGIKKENN